MESDRKGKNFGQFGLLLLIGAVLALWVSTPIPDADTPTEASAGFIPLEHTAQGWQVLQGPGEGDAMVDVIAWPSSSRLMGRRGTVLHVDWRIGLELHVHPDTTTVFPFEEDVRQLSPAIWQECKRLYPDSRASQIIRSRGVQHAVWWNGVAQFSQGLSILILALIVLLAPMQLIGWPKRGPAVVAVCGWSLHGHLIGMIWLVWTGHAVLTLSTSNLFEIVLFTPPLAVCAIGLLITLRSFKTLPRPRLRWLAHPLTSLFIPWVVVVLSYLFGMLALGSSTGWVTVIDHRSCPACATDLTGRRSYFQCLECDAVIGCLQCAYPLTELNNWSSCPECGTPRKEP